MHCFFQQILNSWLFCNSSIKYGKIGSKFLDSSLNIYYFCTLSSNICTQIPNGDRLSQEFPSYYSLQDVISSWADMLGDGSEVKVFLDFQPGVGHFYREMSMFSFFNFLLSKFIIFNLPKNSLVDIQNIFFSLSISFVFLLNYRSAKSVIQKNLIVIKPFFQWKNYPLNWKIVCSAKLRKFCQKISKIFCLFSTKTYFFHFKNHFIFPANL